MVIRTLGAAAALVLAATAASAQSPAPVPSAPEMPASAPVASAGQGAQFVKIAPKGTILQTLRTSGQFTTLLKILDMGGLSGPALLGRTSPITIFAPTNAAFAAMPPAELDRLMQPDNTAQLQSRFVYLIFNGPLDYAALEGKAGPIAGAGGSIYIDASGDPAKVNDAKMLQADVKATNGTIYVIDKVIGPGFTPPAAPAE